MSSGNGNPVFVKTPKEWEFYTIREKGEIRAVIEFDKKAAFELNHTNNHFGFRVEFFIPEEFCSASGIPAKEENKKLEQVENELLLFLESKKVDCKLVGRLTYAAMRELIFQSAERKPFYVQISPWVKASAYPADFEEYEGWSFFDERIVPTEAMLRQISDRKQIEEILKNKKDNPGPLLIHHKFSGPEEGLENLESELIQDHFVRVNKTPGLLVLSKSIELSEHQVFKLTLALDGFCTDLGLKYEGWDVK